MMSKLKKLYSRIAPASKYQIKKTTDCVNGELHSLEEKVLVLNKKIENTQKELSSLQQLNQHFDTINHELNLIKNQTKTEKQELSDSLLKIHDNISHQSSVINQLHENVEESVKNTSDTLISKNETLRNKLSDMDKRLTVLDKKLTSLNNYSYSKYLYYNEYERRVIQSFHDMYQRPDYREHLLALISGMNEEDINKIIRILKRQQELAETDGHLDIFTEEEQQQIKSMVKSFEQEIFRVDDELYIYHNYRLPINHFEASVFYYKHGLDEVRNLAYTYDKDIVDVGGFIGDSVLVLEPYTTKKIYTFEAVRSNFELLKKTLQLNNLNNVVAENLALGKEPGTMEIQIAGSSSTLLSECMASVSGTETVNVVRFDDYVKEHHLKVGLIKIDIEGAEQDFLAGAKETILTQKPILLCSIYHNADDFFHIKPLLESWNVGYKFHIHKPVDKSISREVLLIAEVEV